MSKVIYTEELKEHILSENEAGISVRELARRYEPSATTIQNWKRQAKLKASRSEPAAGSEAELRRCQRRIEELEQENAFLKKAGGLVRSRRRSKEWWNQAYELIEVERKNFTIRLMCRVLEISESGYYRWRQRRRQPSRRARANEKLLASIRGIMVDSKWTYGAPRVAAQLCRNGIKVSVNRVARLMREAGLSASVPKKYVQSTRRGARAHGIEDRVNRQFGVAEPDQLWGGGCDLSAYFGRHAVSGGGAGRLQPAHIGVGDEDLPRCRFDEPGLADGASRSALQRSDSPFGSRRAVWCEGVSGLVSSAWDRAVDGQCRRLL